MSTVGERLSEERKKTGLNQEDFGAFGGVKRNAQYKYEKDKQAIDTDYLEKLSACNEFEFDAVYVVTGLRLGEDGSVIRYSEVSDALSEVLEVQKELGLTFSADQLQSVLGFAYKAHASRDQIAQFVKSAYEFLGQQLPDSQ